MSNVLVSFIIYAHFVKLSRNIQAKCMLSKACIASYYPETYKLNVCLVKLALPLGVPEFRIKIHKILTTNEHNLSFYFVCSLTFVLNNMHDLFALSFSNCLCKIHPNFTF